MKVVRFTDFGRRVANLPARYVGIWDELSTGGNIVGNNTVNESPDGIIAVSPGNDDLTGNTLVNVVAVGP